MRPWTSCWWKNRSCLTVNLGSGQGQSVLGVVVAMEAASARAISYEIIGRSPNGASISVAYPNKFDQRMSSLLSESSKTSAAEAGPGSDKA